MSITLKVFFALLAIANIKVLPFAWTIKFYYYVIKYLFVLPKLKGKKNRLPPSSSSISSSSTNEEANANTSGGGGGGSNTATITKKSTTTSSSDTKPSKSIFQWNEYWTWAAMLECDLNGHKSNSTYFHDLDLARSDLLLDLLAETFIEYRKKEKAYPYVPLGSVMCIFKREIKPFQRYVVRNRILGWDKKWVFVLSRFEFPNGKLAAVGLSKYVFKLKRVTIEPEKIIRMSGIASEEDFKTGLMNFEKAKGMLEVESLTEFTT